MVQECERFGKWIKGCNFEGRYDKGAANANLKVTVHTFDQMATMAEKTRPITYVRDVCTTCGKTIERGAT